MRCAEPGPVYVPFLGDGDIASELYNDREIFGADIDPERTATARGRFTRATLAVEDCNKWPFPDCEARFAVADFDAYSNPYLSLASFWERAEKADRLVLFGTDGYRGAMKMAKSLVEMPAATRGQSFANGIKRAAPPELRKRINFWFPRYVLPWLTELVAPWRIVKKQFYLRGTSGMTYWGIVCDRR